MGEGADHVVQSVAAAADVVDEAGPGQGDQVAGRLRLVRGQQGGGRGGAEGGAAGQGEAAQQPAGGVRLVGVAQPEDSLGGFDRAVRVEVRGELSG
ncbi:hypothetical protein QFZ76_006448 [Streptomyces sp. V4I2]|nr:hypothetical protein [Streptomyces sp. V4I2]